MEECLLCHKQGAYFKCSACKTAFYCSNSCYRKDWARHSSDGCSALAQKENCEAAERRGFQNEVAKLLGDFVTAPDVGFVKEIATLCFKQMTLDQRDQFVTSLGY